MFQTLVDWESVAPKATVVFSSLAIPDCPRCSLNADVAELRLASGLTIDIEKPSEHRPYIVTLYRNDIEEFMLQCGITTSEDVVTLVKWLVEEYGARTSD